MFRKTIRSRDMQVLRGNKAAATFALINTMKSPVKEILSPICLASLGLNVRAVDEIDEFAYISSYGNVRIAIEIATYPNGKGGARTSDLEEIYAVVAGLLFALWQYPEGVLTRQDVLNARAELARRLLFLPIAEVTIDKCIRYAIDICTTSDFYMVDRQTAEAQLCGDVVIPANLRNVSSQVIRAYNLRLNWITEDMVTNETWQRLSGAILGLTNLATDEAVAKPADTTVKTTDWDTKWKEKTIHFWLAMYEMWAMESETDCRTHFMLAAFTALTSLVKRDTVSRGWMQSRIKRLEAQCTGLDLAGLIDDKTVALFYKLYGAKNATSEQLYPVLSAINFIAQASDLTAISWVIEQSAVSQLTTALAFAECINAAPYANLDALIDQIPEIEFKEFADAIGRVCYDRFATLVNTLVHSQAYGDLAYIGWYISLAHRDSSATIGYKGKPSAFCRLSTFDLECIANSILKSSEKIIREQLGTDKQLKRLQDAARVKSREENAAPEHLAFANSKIVVVDGEVYSISAADAARLEGGQNLANQGNEDDQAERARVRGLLRRTERADWPAVLQNTDIAMKKLSPVDIAEKAKIYQSPKASSLRLLCSTLVDKARQIRLDTIPENRCTTATWKKRVPEDIINAIALWGVVIPPEWREEPRDPANIHTNALTDHQLERWSRAYRPVRQNPPRQQEQQIPPRGTNRLPADLGGLTGTPSASNLAFPISEMDFTQNAPHGSNIATQPQYDSGDNASDDELDDLGITTHAKLNKESRIALAHIITKAQMKKIHLSETAIEKFASLLEVLQHSKEVEIQDAHAFIHANPIIARSLGAWARDSNITQDQMLDILEFDNTENLLNTELGDAYQRMVNNLVVRPEDRNDSIN